MTKMIIDALGSDQGPDMVAKAIAKSLQTRDFEGVFVGPKETFERYLSDYSSKMTLLETEEYIENSESPVHALRKKKSSATVLGLNRLNEEDARVFLSAGSTGALLAGGYFITKRLKGIDRACLAATIPNPSGGCLLVDTGANMDCTPSYLLQFAILASSYAKKTLGKKDPKVGLLNIGLEEGKGDKRSLETYDLLKESSLHFIGNVEARDILDPHCDILIADGFVGNTALKVLEGVAKTFMNLIQSSIYQSTKTKIGGLLLKDSLKEKLGVYDYKAYGGAPLLGLRKAIYKAHGNSTVDSFSLAISEAIDFAESFEPDEITQGIEEIENGKTRN